MDWKNNSLLASWWREWRGGIC